GVVLAVGAELVEFDEARQADDQQEDDDEDRDQPAEERLGGEQAFISGAGKEARVPRNGDLVRKPQAGEDRTLSGRRFNRLRPRHAVPPSTRDFARCLSAFGPLIPRIRAFESKKNRVSSKKWLTIPSRDSGRRGVFSLLLGMSMPASTG